MKPRIAVLELIHPSGIEQCRAFSDVDVLTHLKRSELLSRIHVYDAVIIKSVTQIDDEFLHAAPQLKLLARAGTGTDNISFSALKAHGVELRTVPKGNTVSAAEFTIYMMLHLCKRIDEVTKFIDRRDFRRHLLEGRELGEMTVGLIGLGNVGISVAKRLAAFGCRLLGCSKEVNTEFEQLGGVVVPSMEALLSQVDLLSLHVTLNSKTKHILNKDAFASMKEGMLLVNTARGALIDDVALVEALNTGQVKAAALDVLSPEPRYDLVCNDPPYSHVLLEHPKVFVTPHMAASTVDAQKRIALSLAHKIQDFLVNKVSV